MPKYLIEAHYTPEGAKGVAKEGALQRRAAIAKQQLESAGGKLESSVLRLRRRRRFCRDCELPDNVTAAAFALTVNRGSTVSALRTIVLITPEEMEQGRSTLRPISYPAPGQ